MNHLGVLSVICAVVIAGCSEPVDSTFRESSETRNVPTLHLVLDSQNSSCGSDMRPYIGMSYHVQSDRPVEHDTYVWVRSKNDNSDWRLTFTVILAGETQSARLSSSGTEQAVAALPPAHERAKELPTRIHYTDGTGREIRKELLVEYPFNPYNLGSPMELQVEWSESDAIEGTRERAIQQAIHQLFLRWVTAYETEHIDAYISIFDANNYSYVSDMGTPDDPRDDVTIDNIREERDSALRQFSLFRNIEIELSWPLEVELSASQTRAEVKTHYEVIGFTEDGVTLEGGLDGWYAKGNWLFVLQKVQGECEWKITKWLDSDG